MLIGPLEKSERDQALRLLAVQLEEHGVAIDGAVLGRAIDGVLERPERGAFLVAKDAGELIGVAYLSFQWTLEHGGLIAWLEELYVVPARRDHGLGAKLLDAALAEAKARGCAAVDLEIETGHERAANLYLRTGFSTLSRTRWVKKL
jgi:GNAT superfamily N-acetyltransferase